MKKIFLALFMFTFSLLVFASEVSDLLQGAQTAYESGNISTAIQKLDSAKSIMEKEQLNSSSDAYIELSSWDIVKMKKSEYNGKKVKFKDRFLQINSDGTVNLYDCYSWCTYEESLIDKLLTLKGYQEYTFYGTVIINNTSPSLHIEAIE